ncbi:dGTPase [Shewanella baltica]|uniref:dGTPase n=1 Tax=Shewanella baltica TaxID=62322 RepID=UPI00217E8BCB|nr:dGTPase [Shewanella baltica]MCS6122610.1 dGTPase [Shewanella baltica]
MPINFKSKIKPDRPHNFDTPLSKQFESDRGRIINSAAIRRLQQKTQVFPLERNAAVRSRLTHSLEVQQVGRYISQLICEELSKNESSDDNFGLKDLNRELETIVEMSCLMHDIGNPPFGHFGEAALIDWLKCNISDIYVSIHSKLMPESIERDLIGFEGNAQGIRLIHSLLKLNLTYSQASGILKYTRCGIEVKPNKKEDDNFSYLKKKVGFYLSEVDYIFNLRNVLDIDKYCRSPFSYIMEAADDISYGIADLEDAVEKGVISIQQLKGSLLEKFETLAVKLVAEDRKVMEKMLEKASSRSRNEDTMFFVFLRVEVNSRLPKHAQKRFIDNIESVYKGSFNQSLIEDNSVNHIIVETFKQVAREKAFCHYEVEARELQGYRVIAGLMDSYRPLLSMSKEKFSALINGTELDKGEEISIYSKRLFKKLSQKHKSAYIVAMGGDSVSDEFIDEDCREFYYRTRLIIDYISGMTDQFAYDEYRAFHVIGEF